MCRPVTAQKLDARYAQIVRRPLWFLPSVVAGLVVVAACGGAASKTPDDAADAVVANCPQPDMKDQTEITQIRADELLGFSEVAAERCAMELGWAFRVGMRDGEAFALTMDYSLQRVTVEIIDDSVTAIAVG